MLLSPAVVAAEKIRLSLQPATTVILDAVSAVPLTVTDLDAIAAALGVAARVVIVHRVVIIPKINMTVVAQIHVEAEKQIVPHIKDVLPRTTWLPVAQILRVLPQ